MADPEDIVRTNEIANSITAESLRGTEVEEEGYVAFFLSSRYTV